ncbi:competence protein CoiA family protein [Cellulomonas sp. 179-A 9B4 NHS]|uniref:competence protein CoiA family protein n=1 Tax=Cellulomonas sp. 179-A 9B4 NHS TaxID=3142379 RepID=UPI0039A3E844
MTDSPTGTATVVAPPSHDAAARLKAAHRTFWCTTQAGGCGGVLILYVGTVRVPHFQHLPGASPCVLSSRDAAPAYAHLAYQRELTAWLADQGYDARIEHRFDDAGRADLHVLVGGVAHTLEVQLTDIAVDAWQDRDARYRTHVDHVRWLHGPASTTTARTERVTRDYALRIGRDEVGGVRIGVDTTGVEAAIAWVSLAECRMTAAGVWVPQLEAALRNIAARADAARRPAAEEATSRQLRVPQLAALERRTGAHVEPPPGLRTTADWRRLQPDLPLWGPDHPGWAWMREHPVEQHAAGMYLAMTVTRLYFRGAYSMLANPDLPAEVVRSMVEDMTAAGWLYEDTRRAPEPMWRRGERAPAGY